VLRHGRRRDHRGAISRCHDDRRELIATCQRNGKRYEIALLDVTIDGDPATSRLLAAYRRWSGT
jgi:hypothetical protein